MNKQTNQDPWHESRAICTTPPRREHRTKTTAALPARLCRAFTSHNLDTDQPSNINRWNEKENMDKTHGMKPIRKATLGSGQPPSRKNHPKK
jgi:hypothetical protein